MSIVPPLVLVILLQAPAAPVGPSPSLYAIENIKSDRGAVETRSLVRLSIDRDRRLVKDTLLTRDQRFFSEFRRHRIERGRYLVTGSGGIIDIPAGKVIHDEHFGDILGVVGPKVFYRVDNSLRPSGVFSFDLNERVVAKVEPGGRWDLPGLPSPDWTMSLDHQRFDGTIRLCQLGKPPRVLLKPRITHSIYSSSATGAALPCLWLDPGRILAGRTNRELVVLDTQRAVEATIEVKDASTEIVSSPVLWSDPLGRVIYECGDGYFLIDVPGRTASPLEDLALGHGFEVSVAEDEEQRSSVRYQGRVIGQWACEAFAARVAPGRIAFPYVRPARNANLGYPDGVAVWDAEVGDWRTTPMWVEALVGWAP